MVDHRGTSEGQLGGLGDARSLPAAAGQRRGAQGGRGVGTKCHMIDSLIEEVTGSAACSCSRKAPAVTAMGTPLWLLLLT